MSEDKQRSNHATVWIVTLIALPVFYVLSWAPVLGLYYNGTIPEPAWPWVKKFYQPVDWLWGNTPLQKPLNAYYFWWDKVLKKPRNPVVW